MRGRGVCSTRNKKRMTITELLINASQDNRIDNPEMSMVIRGNSSMDSDMENSQYFFKIKELCSSLSEKFIYIHLNVKFTNINSMA